MTAANSNNKSFFKNRFINNLKENKQYIIVNCIFELLGLPVLTFIGIIIMYYDNNNMSTTVLEAGCISFAVISFCTMSASVLMGTIIAHSHFKYLYKKQITDMHYSLPLSSTQRFFADYLSGLSIYLVPPIFCILFSLLMILMGSAFTNLTEIVEELPFLLSIAGIIIVGMIQYYTIAIFALVFCGKTFEVNFSTLAFFVMIPSTIGCLWLAMTEESAFGVNQSAIFTKSIFTSTNPAGTFAFVIRFCEDSTSHANNYLELTSSAYSMLFRWIGTTVFVTALYLGVAYFLYCRRKAEDVSKPYVYRAFFYAIMSMGTFCILSLFIIGEGFVMAGIVICAIAWFIMELISRRGFRKFWTAFVGFGTSVIAVFAVCWLCDVTEGFGMARHLPASISVERVTISSETIPGYVITTSDKDVINACLDLNKEIIDRHFNPQNYTYTPYPKNKSTYDYRKNYYTSPTTFDHSINFSYKTYTGSRTERNYYINTGMEGEILKAVLLSDDYAKHASKDFGTRNYSSGNVEQYDVSIKDKFDSQTIRTKTLTKPELDELSAAYEKDLKNMTEEQLVEGKVCFFMDKYFVLESFENTLEFLNMKAPEIRSREYGSIKVQKNPVYASNIQSHMEENTRYYYGSSQNLSAVDTFTNVRPNYNYDNSGITIRTRRNGENESCDALLKACTPLIFNEKPLAIVCVGNYSVFLRDTDENQAILEKVLEENDADDKYYYDDDYYDDYDYYNYNEWD